MTTKLEYILLLGAALVTGYLAGRFIRKCSVNRLAGLLLYNRRHELRSRSNKFGRERYDESEHPLRRR